MWVKKLEFYFRDYRDMRAVSDQAFRQHGRQEWADA
jgi:hypothetical protein